MISPDGVKNLDRMDAREDSEAAPAPEYAGDDMALEVAPASAPEPAPERGGPREGVWLLNRKKMLAIHSGSDPSGSEKVSSGRE